MWISEGEVRALLFPLRASSRIERSGSFSVIAGVQMRIAELHGLRKLYPWLGPVKVEVKYDMMVVFPHLTSSKE